MVVGRLFRGVGSTGGPLALTLASTVIFTTQAAVAHSAVRAAVTGVTWLLVGIAPWTFFWVYVSLQLGLDRLGRGRLTLTSYPEDRSLGLKPVGKLAFEAFAIFVVATAPLVLVTIPSDDVLGLALAIGVLLAGVVVFFLSLRRLHVQMVTAKEGEVTWARSLYRKAYAPVRSEGSLERLKRQTELLSAAESLERRAERIQEWPFDEATFARVVTIATSVVAAFIGRLVLNPLGL